MRRRRVLGGSAVVLVAVVGAAGYGPSVCSTIGYVPTLVVEAGTSPEVVDVEVCVADACASSIAPEPGSASTDVGSGSSWGPVTQLSDSSWSFPVFDERPDEVRVRFLAEGGGVLAEMSVALAWERVGGTEDCGGPSKAVVTAPTR